MMVRFKKTILILSMFLLLLISACSSNYVCSNGEVVSAPEECEVIPQPKIRDIQAERTVDNYAAAYARALGVSHSRINTYREEGNWHSVVLFTDTIKGEVHTITFEVDGITATVSCYDGCEYITKKEVDKIEAELEQETQNGAY